MDPKLFDATPPEGYKDVTPKGPAPAKPAAKAPGSGDPVRDVAYYGTTVRLNDKDKVLLRWRLDDGRYEVIFGDLRSETVTAERLHALEGK